jgi:hypothetical protein
MVCYIYSQLVMVRSIELYLYKHHTRILDVLSWSFVGKLSLIDKVALIFLISVRSTFVSLGTLLTYTFNIEI